MPSYPRRGEIYYVQMDKKRPAVVVSVNGRNEHAKNVLVVPISETYRDYPTHIVLNPGESGLSRISAAKCELVTNVEKDVVDKRPVGSLGRDRMRDVEKGIMRAIGVPV
ncbi:MAG: type II toxin-antitoxin system PemK/MazF family toxin [candidate division WOR-3 bacterium]